MRVVALSDFGSTFTKVTLAEENSGRFLGQAHRPTTVQTDVMDDYHAALDDAVRQVDERLDVVAELAASSAGGGLRMAAVGPVDELTAAAGRQAALNAGAKVELVAATVAARFRRLGRTVHVVDNVLPAIDRLNIEPARRAIHEMFIRHVIGGKGLSASSAFETMVLKPTPEAVLDAVRLLATRTGSTTHLTGWSWSTSAARQPTSTRR